MSLRASTTAKKWHHTHIYTHTPLKHKLHKNALRDVHKKNSCSSQQSGIVHLGVAEGWKTGSTRVNFLLFMATLSHVHGMVQPWRYEAKVQNTTTYSEDFILCLAWHSNLSYSSVVHKHIWVTTYISLLPACIQFNTNTNRLKELWGIIKVQEKKCWRGRSGRIC